MKKEIVAAGAPPDPQSASDWIDLETVARIRLTSEDATHPIESALGASPSTGWRASQPGEQTIWISFDAPQPIREISLGFHVSASRTQEFALSSSSDGGIGYRELVRQQFNFSASTPREEESYRPNLTGVTDVKLVIRPDIADDRAHATLNYLRLR